MIHQPMPMPILSLSVRPLIQELRIDPVLSLVRKQFVAEIICPMMQVAHI
jgi:hypothetical protein